MSPVWTRTGLAEGVGCDLTLILLGLSQKLIKRFAAQSRIQPLQAIGEQLTLAALPVVPGKVFATADAAAKWFEENDPGDVAFE
jgi:hypothetical protein